MALLKRQIASDEELGKKSDEYNPSRPGTSAGGAGIPPSLRPTGIWRGSTMTRRPLRWRRKRIVYAGLFAILLWMFLYRRPASLFGPTNGFRGISQTDYDASQEEEPTGPPPREPRGARGGPLVVGEKEHYYEGLIRFFRLSSSLRKVSDTSGYQNTNRNVLFAAASLRSASALIPMACDMAKWNRNHVHFAIMGREDMPLGDIIEINNAAEECKVWWHDARPDYTEYSTDLRAEAGVSAAMNHIQHFMHPQVVIVDESEDEERWFLEGMRNKVKRLDIPCIEVPGKDREKLMFLTHLDSGSLKNWHKTSINILVQAAPAGSGSLVRLLKSIEKADYTGFAYPHITVELPPTRDLPTEVFLRNMQWPPRFTLRPSQPRSQLTVHRRIPSRHTTPAEASAHFLESIYPADENDHVLVLTPQAELSPVWFHYLMYTMLEYRYSSWGYSDLYRSRLQGISLEAPASYLNGTAPFVHPKFRDISPGGYVKEVADQDVPFMWEAPNSNAALFFADKWREVHAFVTRRLQAFEEQEKRGGKARKKLVSAKYPGWMEFMLELMRARGYNMVYPPRQTAEQVVTIHTDLYQPPEEFNHPPPSTGDPSSDKEPEDTDPFLPPISPQAALAPPKDIQPKAPNTAAYTPLHHLLPFSADLPDLPDIPYLSHSGVFLPQNELWEHHWPYARAFREHIGGCAPRVAEAKSKKIEPEQVDDLFCLGAGGDGGGDDGGVDAGKELDAETVAELFNWRNPPEERKKSITGEGDEVVDLEVKDVGKVAVNEEEE